MSKKPPARASKEKKETVKTISKQIEESPSVGIVNMHGMPADALNNVRGKLRGRAEIIMARKTLLKKALEGSKKEGIQDLEENMEGMPALIFSQENPFKIYKVIKKSKTPAPAKAGEQAPKDITISAGPTPFGPGPIISEFAKLGIKAAVEDGKVVVKADKVIPKGETISPDMASMLTKLDIKPFEIGMDVVCIYENGTIFPGTVLDIDEEQFIANLTQAAQEAFNLGVEAVIFTTETTEPMLQKAWREAKAVALEGSVLADEVVGDLLAKAESQAMSVKTEAKL